MKQNQAKKIAVLFFLVLISLIVLIHPVYAQDSGLVPCGHTDPRTGTVTNPCDFQDLVALVMKVINLLLGFSWLVATFFVFWGGWKMVTAYGNSEGIQNGKDTLRHAIIGFFLVMVAFILLNFVVASFTGNKLNLNSNDQKSILKFLPFPN